VKKKYTISINNNISREEAEKMIRDYFNIYDWRECIRREKRKERVTKLNKIFK